jgi:hypothetical protein
MIFKKEEKERPRGNKRLVDKGKICLEETPLEKTYKKKKKID